MSHLISIELDDEIAKRLVKDLKSINGRYLGPGTSFLPDLIFAIEEAIDSDDG